MTESQVNQPKKSKGLIMALALAGQVSVLLVAPVAVCLGLGIWLDNYFKSEPVFLVTGVILGFVVSIINVFRVMKLIEKISE